MFSLLFLGGGGEVERQFSFPQFPMEAPEGRFLQGNEEDQSVGTVTQQQATESDKASAGEACIPVVISRRCRKRRGGGGGRIPSQHFYHHFQGGGGVVIFVLDTKGSIATLQDVNCLFERRRNHQERERR